MTKNFLKTQLRTLCFLNLIILINSPILKAQEERPTPNYTFPKSEEKSEWSLIPIHGQGYDGSIYPKDYGMPNADKHKWDWTPSPVEIQRAEKGLEAFILQAIAKTNQKKLLEPLSNYVRFYTGGNRNFQGQKLLNIHLVLIPHKKWREADYRKPLDFYTEESISVDFDLNTGRYLHFDLFNKDTKFKCGNN